MNTSPRKPDHNQLVELREKIAKTMFDIMQEDGVRQYVYYTGGGPHEHANYVDPDWVEAMLNDVTGEIKAYISDEIIGKDEPVTGNVRYNEVLSVDLTANYNNALRAQQRQRLNNE